MSDADKTFINVAANDVLVFGTTNTPALHTGFISGPPPEEPQYKQLVQQAKDDKIPCQRALIGMYLIRPYSDYEPTVSSELRGHLEWIKTIGDSRGLVPLQLILYEQDGLFIMSEDYEVYGAYKEREPLTVEAIVLGTMTEQWYAIVLGGQFSLKSLLSIDPDKSEQLITARIKQLLKQQDIRHEELDLRLGIERGRVLDILNDHETLTVEMLEKIAKGLGVKSSDILPF